MKQTLLYLFIVLISTFGFSQNIEQRWTLDEKQNEYIEFVDGTYAMSIKADSTLQKGDYLIQGNYLFLFENGSDAPTRRFVVEFSEDQLILKNRDVAYSFFSVNKPKLEAQDSIIENQGFGTHSLIRGALGMFTLIFVAFLFSSNRKGIRWKTVLIGLSAQLLLAIGILKIAFVQAFFDFVGKGFTQILEFTRAGSIFLLGDLMDSTTFGFIFLFQVLPTIIFFSALTSLLFYLGIIQWVVRGLAIALTRLLKISGAESLSVAGNIFLGQTEAPLLIKAYLEKMTKSEILLVMIGGMATVAGGVLAAYVGFLGGGNPEMEAYYVRHLLAASVMAAPGAIVISKILFPQTEAINTDVEISKEKIGSNVLDAVATGTSEGLRLAANVGAMLLVFIAFIAMINGLLSGVASFDGIRIESLGMDWTFVSLNEIIAQKTPYDAFSLQFILGYLFSPLMWLIGVATEDMMLMGQLLGIKLAASEFVGYIELASLKDTTSTLHFTYQKSVIMATYMLCGFANFASIGIQIGGIGSLAPNQRKILSEFGIKAVIGGSLASLLSATIAGMIMG